MSAYTVFGDQTSKVLAAEASATTAADVVGASGLHDRLMIGRVQVVNRLFTGAYIVLWILAAATIYFTDAMGRETKVLALAAMAAHAVFMVLSVEVAARVARAANLASIR
jgi:hypothetical protein